MKLDLVSIYPPIGIIIDGIMVFLIAKHYLKTRYRPTFILLLHYVVFVIDHILWIPISTLGFDQVIPAKSVMIATIYVVLVIPCFTVTFFESSRNKPNSILVLIFVTYFFFLVGYGFYIDWVFEFDRIWRYDISETILALFMLPFFGAVAYIFIQLFKILFNFPKATPLRLQWKTGKRSKLLVLFWSGGLCFRYLSMLLIAAEGVSEFNFIIRLGSVILVALVFLYDPSSFFLSDAQIKAFLIFDAQSGVLLYSMGGAQDDLRAAGLCGATTFERDITGASSLPHILLFPDRVILIMYQKVEEKLLAAAMIVDKYNPIFQPSLQFGLQQFIKEFHSELRDWGGDQMIFERFNQKSYEIFNYAYNQRIKTSEN